MSNGQMSIDSQAVAAAVNQIDLLIADIDTRNKKFITLLTEKNQVTKGKFQLLKTLQERVEQEANNIKGAIDATETIKEAIRKYEDMASDVNDDTAFRRGM